MFFSIHVSIRNIQAPLGVVYLEKHFFVFMSLPVNVSPKQEIGWTGDFSMLKYTDELGIKTPVYKRQYQKLLVKQ